MIFPISKAAYKILERIYFTNGIKVSKLLKEASVSQKVGYKHIDNLIKLGIIKEEIIGSLRILRPNLKNEAGQFIYGLLEKEKEIEFYKNHPELSEPIKLLKLNAFKNDIEIIVILGNIIDKNIDIMIISESNEKKVLNFLQECFKNTDYGVSARILTKEKFRKFKGKKDLFNALFLNHVCILNIKKLISLLAE